MVKMIVPDVKWGRKVLEKIRTLRKSKLEFLKSDRKINFTVRGY